MGRPRKTKELNLNELGYLPLTSPDSDTLRYSKDGLILSVRPADNTAVLYAVFYDVSFTTQRFMPTPEKLGYYETLLVRVIDSMLNRQSVQNDDRIETVDPDTEPDVGKRIADRLIGELQVYDNALKLAAQEFFTCNVTEKGIREFIIGDNGKFKTEADYLKSKLDNWLEQARLKTALTENDNEQ